MLAYELGVAEDVIFLGKVLDIDRILRCTDVFMLPSEKESFGLAALEAMACAVPVVSSNTGGIPEVNIHNETGFVANVGDVEAMSKYVLHILNSPAEEERMRVNAKRRSLLFDIEQIAPQYEKIYEDILAS